MNRIINAILLQDVRTEAEWSSANPVVEKDKICYSSDKGNYKIGNGTSHWSELKYNYANALDVPSWAKQSTKPSYTKAEVGLSNVENKSSETIRSELTKANVINALGYTPPTTNTTYAVFGGATQDKAGTIGLVPAPVAGSNSNRFLKADGTWAIPPNTTYNVATQSSNGLMSSTDKTKLDGIQSGAQKNSITGIKGDAESSYRTGNVNITPANIGAANASHSHTSANISDLYSKIYPVGIILPFANSSDPNTLFTGTKWTKVAPGRVLIGAGTLSDGSVSKTFTPGTTGGKYQAKLTTANMPAHTHSVSVNVKRESITTGSGSTTGYIPATGVQGSSTYSSSGTSGSSGSGSGFDTLPPYFPVYLWQRTS